MPMRGLFAPDVEALKGKVGRIGVALLLAMIASAGAVNSPAVASPFITYEVTGDLATGTPFEYLLYADTSKVQQVGSNLVVPTLEALLDVGGNKSLQSHIGFLDVSSFDVGDILHISPNISELEFQAAALGTYDLISNLGPISVKEIGSVPVFADVTNLEFQAKVPEPASLTLFVGALLGFAFWRRRKQI